MSLRFSLLAAISLSVAVSGCSFFVNHENEARLAAELAADIAEAKLVADKAEAKLVADNAEAKLVADKAKAEAIRDTNAFTASLNANNNSWLTAVAAGFILFGSENTTTTTTGN